jgi:hypothetical protein
MYSVYFLVQYEVQVDRKVDAGVPDLQGRNVGAVLSSCA